MRYLMVAAVLGLAVAASAQDKKDPPKEKPKGLPRIALREPTDAAKDPAFAVQGEYEGDVQGKKFGAQVVARGEGTYFVRLLEGGLPGAGWDGKTKTEGAAKTVDSKIVLEKGLDGSLENGVLKLKVGGLKRVERKSSTLGEKAPSGAIVLFEKPEDLEKWNDAEIAKLSDGEFLSCKPGKNILTKAAFKNFKVHIEFRLAWMPNSTGQQRSNSGLYLQNRYELQMLDSFGLKGLDNECGGFYTQYAPSVNMCLPPMVWQTYDIEFTAAEIGADGKVSKPAHATVFHNGVKVQDNVALKGPTPGGKPEDDKPGPLHLQWHGDPLVYRNIWVVEMK